jgi:hypothetical protein
MNSKLSKKVKDNQRVGNIGLYYVCYRLSRDGWNVMPTSRNARGVDIVAYDQEAKQKLTLQVKSLSKHLGVPLGGSVENLIADYVVICFDVAGANPGCSIMKPDEIRNRVVRQEKDGKPSYWLSHNVYREPQYKWGRIGSGLK